MDSVENWWGAWVIVYLVSFYITHPALWKLLSALAKP